MNTFKTKNFHIAAYIMTVMDAPLPDIERGTGPNSTTFIFPDPTGELAWAAECFHQDATVQRFCNSLRKLKNLIKGK